MIPGGHEQACCGGKQAHMNASVYAKGRERPGPGTRTPCPRLAATRVLGVLAVMGLFACETVPITGRQQLILMSASEENRMGITAYEQVLKGERESRDPQLHAMVTRVGQRIAAVAE